MSMTRMTAAPKTRQTSGPRKIRVGKVECLDPRSSIYVHRIILGLLNLIFVR